MSASPDPLRIAVFGTGLAWRPHRESLRDLSARIEVAWLVGRSLERVRQEAPHFEHAQATTRVDDVLDDSTVKAALVLTPPHTHYELVERLARRGIHVLVEKPLDADSERARELVAVCKRHGVTLGVVLQHRMRPAVRKLKALIDAGALGELTHAAVEVRWWRPQSYYDEPGRGTKARDGGGVLMTQAIHTLDLFLHLVGRVQEVAAFAATSKSHRMECEDVVTGIARLEGGALATLHASTAAYPGFPERIDISGTGGTATLTAGELSVRFVDGREEHFGERVAVGAGADPMAFAHDAHRALIDDFANAVRQARPPAATGDDAWAVQCLIDGLLEASRRRGPVALDAATRS